MEWLVIGIALFIIFTLIGSSSKGEKDEAFRKVMKDIIDKEQAKLDNMIAERDALVEKIELMKEQDKPISDDMMLITKLVYDTMCRVTWETCNIILKACKESSFQNNINGINKGSVTPDNGKEVYDSMKFFIVQDILRNYERLGHKYYTKGQNGQKVCHLDFNTSEGQLLFGIIMCMIRYNYGRGAVHTWDEYKDIVKGNSDYANKIRDMGKDALETFANADVKASASNGKDDFALCIILYNYNLKYEIAYKQKMAHLAMIIADADGKITKRENKWLDSLEKSAKEDESVTKIINEIKNPEAELNSMIGLRSVKNEINTLCNFIIMKKKREEEGLKTPSISYHCVFVGNPGTGKTTVARILASIYKDLGVLQKGHLIETDRSGLVAEYVGQTAVKTNKIIDSALDGVLFIDEAYTLANGGNNDYGAEAIATLLKRMEDDRDRLVVILAGYTKEIENFINSNPGLRSRFNRYINFEDYSASELNEIFWLQVRKNEYTLSDDAAQYIEEQLKEIVANKPRDFGNARYVRNLFEKAIEAQANRLAKAKNISKQDLTLIIKDDFMQKETKGLVQQSYVTLDSNAYLEAKMMTERQNEKKKYDDGKDVK